MPKSKEFISSSESETDEPKPKKKKEAKKPKNKEEKTENNSKVVPKKTGAAGEQMFQLSKMRFVSVSEFRGKVLVGIREYYEADGDLRPGKKGISLTLEQWNSLKDQMEEIDRAVKEV
ncbi:activated RNA polymerase II transcriptional coactivator p15-like [Mizuhopecten yessoensis]|nr:activated RNA polymerase II transcriptional coactivator p15-like [Mizuhopecten yessoensis]